jgi:hypothetical protein
MTSVTRAPRPSSLADVLDLILDKGLVIDAYVRVSLVGIEILTIDARIVIASVDTYLHFAEAVNRLDLRPTETQGLPEFLDSVREGSHGGDQRNGSQRNGGQSGDSEGDGEGKQRQRGALGRGSSPPDRSDGDSEDEKESGKTGIVGRLAQRGRWQE